MSYVLLEEIGDSDFNDHAGRNKTNYTIVVEDDDAESSCCDSYDHHDNFSRGKKNKQLVSPSGEYSHGDDEADSSSRKVMNVNGDDYSNAAGGGARKKLKSSVSESAILSTSFGTGTGVVNNNIDEITDDKLFWEFCLAHGYP